MFGKQACLVALCAVAAFAVACSSSVQRTALEPYEAAAQSAKEAFHQSRFEDSANAYMSAIALAKDPVAAAKCRSALADVYREWAMRLAFSGKDETSADDYNKAISLCFAAIEMDPGERIKCESMIAKFQERISILKHRASVAERDLIPYDKPKHEQVDVYMALARAWSKAGCYEIAQKRLEKALSIDSANQEVAQALAAVRNKLAANPASEIAQHDARRVHVADVAWMNSELKKTPPPDTAKSLREAFIVKLNIKDATLNETFRALIPPDASVFYAFEGFDPESKEFPLIAFKAENSTLEDVLRALCASAKLRFVPGANGRVAIFKGF